MKSKKTLSLFALVLLLLMIGGIILLRIYNTDKKNHNTKFKETITESYSSLAYERVNNNDSENKNIETESDNPIDEKAVKEATEKNLANTDDLVLDHGHVVGNKYENAYFTLEFPKDWEDTFTFNANISRDTVANHVFMEHTGLSSQPVIIYSFDESVDLVGHTSGGIDIYVYPNGYPYSFSYDPPPLYEVGYTSFGVPINKTDEYGKGFFSRGVKITLK